MYDKDEIKNSLTIEQVTELVVACGASYPDIEAEVIRVETICHNLPGESRKKRLYYYDNTKLFRCYTDCGEIFDIFELVIKVRKIQHEQEWEMPQAIRWVADFFGIQARQKTFDDAPTATSDILSIINKLENKIQKPENAVHQELVKYDDSILKNLSFIPSIEWIREGITVAAMQKFGIKYYPVSEKIVIPHYNENGELIGIRGRALVQEEAEMFGKYMPLKLNNKMYNHPLSFALYGLNENKENIKRIRKAIIFESEKSVMLFESMFSPESNVAVACCGSSVSTHQINLLLELGVEEVIIAFDRQFQTIGDKEFQNHTRNLRNIVNKFEKQTKVTIMFDKTGLLGYKDAPIDCGRETFLKLYNTRISL